MAFGVPTSLSESLFQTYCDGVRGGTEPGGSLRPDRDGDVGVREEIDPSDGAKDRRPLHPVDVIL
jgi:hypothetical protein